MFHTGRHSIEARRRLTDITGDRNNPAHLERLPANHFDVCIDTCAYFPEQVRLARTFIHTAHYCLISTVYVYEDHEGPIPESHNRIRPAKHLPLKVTAANYAELKVLCEDAAIACFGPRSLIIRPTIMIGPGDHTERMAFWVRLIAKHRKLIRVCKSLQKLQFVDVRDLTRFVQHALREGREGPVNVAGEVVDFDEVIRELACLSQHEPTKISVQAVDLPKMGLDELPYFDSARQATYATDLAKSWGFESRPITASLSDIFSHERANKFALKKFITLEVAALKLFT